MKQRRVVYIEDELDQYILADAKRLGLSFSAYFRLLVQTMKSRNQTLDNIGTKK